MTRRLIWSIPPGRLVRAVRALDGGRLGRVLSGRAQRRSPDVQFHRHGIPERVADDEASAIAEAGFEGVELFEADLLADTHTPREIGRMIADLGLRCVTLQPFRDFEGLPDARRAAVFDRAERKLDLLHDLGTDLLMVCSSTVADAPAITGGSPPICTNSANAPVAAVCGPRTRPSPGAPM